MSIKARLREPKIVKLNKKLTLETATQGKEQEDVIVVETEKQKEPVTKPEIEKKKRPKKKTGPQKLLIIEEDED